MKDVAVLVTNMNKKNVAYEKDTIKSLSLRCDSQKRKKTRYECMYESFEKCRKSFNWDEVSGTIVTFIVTRKTHVILYIYKYITGA